MGQTGTKSNTILKIYLKSPIILENHGIQDFFVHGDSTN